MCAKMTRERAEEFGAAWNSRNADLVTSFFLPTMVFITRLSDQSRSAEATLARRAFVAVCRLSSTGFLMANSKI
jgi:hypothetical protein